MFRSKDELLELENRAMDGKNRGRGMEKRGDTRFGTVEDFGLDFDVDVVLDVVAVEEAVEAGGVEGEADVEETDFDGVCF